MPIKYLICLPTYNEAENIQNFLTQLNAAISQFDSGRIKIDILNIDDNSPDGTAELARINSSTNFFQLSRAVKSGLGPAYLAGFRWAKERNYDFVVEMDADGSHHPTELKFLIEASTDSDLVIGTRWMPGGSVENWPWYRRFVSKLGTKYASMTLRLPYKDLTSGFRVLDMDLVESLLESEISTKGYGFQIEVVLLARKFGAAISQIPITFTERSSGKSKMTSGIVLEAFWSITRWSLLSFKRR